ncbi:UNVERIFIED_CONTAM: hypothetical protein Slati_1501300 [Sesamum latifolium]|uniref:Reverse transcriptase/retrotransposon-derived protein RNase H-like domain-containing protein n=1 Tax=Sesamum latifolium TaxID=2727402 RepID=A0AAW2X5Q6_9LAMI
MEDAPIIQFGRAERSGPQTTHNDALAIAAMIANYEVGRIFIDSGSSADILFGEAYNQMQLGDVSLEKVNTSLYGFAGEVVRPQGMVLLPLTMGRGTTRKTCLLKFLVVDVPSAYNVILGRPTLNTFQAVVSTYHMKIKFPTPKRNLGQSSQDQSYYRYESSYLPQRSTKAKIFEWGTPCQLAFEELKAYLSRLPLLVKPSPGETLYLYLSIAPQAVSSVLIREEDGKQLPIYYVSKLLSGAEGRYTPIEKIALALVVTARRLRPYFLSHPVGVKTNTPLKQTLEMAEMTIKDVSQDQKWLLHVDGSSTAQGSGAGIVITTPQGEDLEFAIKFGFKASNNEAEPSSITSKSSKYLEKKTPRQISSQNLQVALRITEQGTSPYTTSLKPGPPGCPTITTGEDWRTPIIKWIEEGLLPENRWEAARLKIRATRFIMQEHILYKKSYTHPLLRCLSTEEGIHILQEIHSRCCGAHAGTRILANKALRAGYFWPTMKQDAIRLVSKCERCQKHSSLIHQPAEPLTTMLSPCPFMQMDIVGPFPLAAGQRKFLLVAIDYFTKWVKVEPLARITEEK